MDDIEGRGIKERTKKSHRSCSRLNYMSGTPSLHALTSELIRTRNSTDLHSLLLHGSSLLSLEVNTCIFQLFIVILMKLIALSRIPYIV